MDKLTVSKVIKNVERTLTKYSPEILTGIGIAGMITTTVLAVKATPKAIRLIQEKEDAVNDKLTPVEKVKTTWKCYIPAALSGVTSVACIVGANSVHAKRNAALAAVYKISETALHEYREKVLETLGEKKEQAIRDKIAEDRVNKDPVSKTEVIITAKGDTLCYDVLSGRYFKSDIDKIRRAENELNRRMLNDMYVSLNEFYDEIGVSQTSLGDELGWNIDDGLIEVCFSSQIADDGTPCIVVDYRVAPKYNYSKIY